MAPCSAWPPATLPAVAWELGYSAMTEQATVIAYHLIVNRFTSRSGAVEHAHA